MAQVLKQHKRKYLFNIKEGTNRGISNKIDTKCIKNKQQNGAYIYIYPPLSLISLNVNQLSTPIKRQILSQLISKI